MSATEPAPQREAYRFADLRRDVAADLDAYSGFWSEYHLVRAGWRHRLSALLTPSVLACAMHRMAHLAWRRGLRRSAIAIARCNTGLTRIAIHPASRIGGGLYIPHPATGIVFQGRAGRDLRLFAGSAVLAHPVQPFPCFDPSRAPTLGDGVAIGAKACVTGPVRVGDRVRIGFNAVVAQDVPAGATVVVRRRPYVRARR
jgi:serine O-acetyltransferase